MSYLKEQLREVWVYSGNHLFTGTIWREFPNEGYSSHYLKHGFKLTCQITYRESIISRWNTIKVTMSKEVIHSCKLGDTYTHKCMSLFMCILGNVKYRKLKNRTALTTLEFPDIRSGKTGGLHLVKLVRLHLESPQPNPRGWLEAWLQFQDQLLGNTHSGRKQIIGQVLGFLQHIGDSSMVLASFWSSLSCYGHLRCKLERKYFLLFFHQLSSK